MNHRPSGLILKKAIEGFIYFKVAEGLSPNSIVSYRHDLRLFLEHLGNIQIEEIVSRDIVKYLAWLRTEYVPIRKNGKTHGLANKTLRNHWVTLSSFFRWFSEEFETSNPMKKVPAPRFVKAPIEPYTRAEIQALIKVCTHSRHAKTRARKSFAMRRRTVTRDKAIILTLLDTGLRASELCSLHVGDIDIGSGKITIQPGFEGGAKGGKGRLVFSGRTSRRAIWRYLAEREDGEESGVPLFQAKYSRPLSPNGLRQLISRLGQRAGISPCYPHRFRHTFAITYLRSGGDVFTLQSLLGHSSLDMVQHYARVAEIDIEKAHRMASPVDNWRL